MEASVGDRGPPPSDGPGRLPAAEEGAGDEGGGDDDDDSIVVGSVVLQIAAEERSLKVLYENEEIKTIPLKGLYGQPIPFEAYLEVIRQEAVSEWRSYLHKHRRYLPVAV